jgi:2',3'-cyclic-nucleotide 2'-phosphodiesterase (5'-nucleotidase family)
MSILTRRSLMASVGLSAAGFGVSAAGFEAAAGETPAKPDGKPVTLLHFTDSHAQLETHPDYLPGASQELQMMGGFARLKTAIERERANCKNACLLLDSGDDFQGSGPAAWSRGEVILEPLKNFGLDVFVPGNWEPAYGPEIFKSTMSRMICPVACYNFHDIASGNRLFPAAVTIDRQGVKTVVVGVTDIGASTRQPPAEFHGMDTTRMKGLRDYVKEIRAREKPDLVVLLSHAGLTIARQLARDVPEFDVVLNGHTHERTAVPILEGHVIVTEPGCFGSFLSRLDLVLKPGGGVAHYKYKLVPVLGSVYPEDAGMKALVDKSLAPYRGRMAKEVGQTETVLMRYDLFETTADDFISDAVRETAGTEIGFTNGFRFGTPVPPGAVTEADLWNLLPMDARLKSGWVTGKELRAYFEEELETVYSKNPYHLNGGWGVRSSGLTLAFKALADAGQRVVSIKVNGKEIDPDGKYAVAGCEREGEALDVICRHPGSHDPKILGSSVHEALIAYLKAHPVIAPRRDGREGAVDLPPVVFSQDAVLAGGELSKAPTTPFGMPPV